MCGISAIVGFGQMVKPENLLAMNQAILHRGPDDGGFVFFDANSDEQPSFLRDRDASLTQHQLLTGLNPYLQCKVGLGHRRLSILDTSDAGLQPMQFGNGRYWISYNGEIYNYIELRTELTGLGHVFRSHSDTEVLLAAYQTWGPDCLHRFNGMFAFVLFDRLEQRIFAARDRLGVKPLYFWQSPHGDLHFASEIKQFTGLPGWAARLQRARSYDFLAWGLTDHTRDTCFQDVFQLLPGHCLTFRINVPEDCPAPGKPWTAERRWYRLKSSAVAQSLPDAAQELKRLLRNAVSLRLRSDVRVGANLSGGIDSSSIVCLLHALHKLDPEPEDFYCLTAASGYPEFDETQHVNEVLRRVHGKPLLIQTSMEELERDVLQLVWHQDEPFGSTSIFAEWSIYKQAKLSGLKVMLGGQGADEQLAGYRELLTQYYRGWARNFSFAPMLADLLSAHQSRGASWAQLGIQLADALLPQAIRQPLLALRGAPSSQPKWLNLRALDVSAHDPLASLGFRDASVQGASLIQLNHTSLPMQLHWEDRDSMAHSVESRAPFLDVELVEYLHGLPDHFRYANGETKRILRAAMRQTVPDGILDRRDKMGFVTPESIWVKNQGRPFFQKAIARAVDNSAGIIQPSAIRYFQEMIDGKRRFSQSLWRAAVFGMWIDRFNVVI
jgi:asparagine synthase (glutamine-hydrolysing)